MQNAAAPLIYSPRSAPVRVSPSGRILSLAISLTCLSMLVAAALLKPNPTGMGTHLGLGLQPCGFQRTFGLPCPSCGMTTSWAWFARGNLAASFWIQPMGMILALFACVTFWGGLYIAVSGRAAHHLLGYLPGRYIVMPLLVAVVLAWGWKIFIHLHHLDGWR